MHAEDFLHHEDHRKIPPLRRLRAVGRHFAALARNLHFAGEQAGGWGLDRRLRHHRLHGEREAGAQRADDEAPTVDGNGRLQAGEIGARFEFVRHGSLLV